jgi:spore coat protein U-like protein
MSIIPKQLIPTYASKRERDRLSTSMAIFTRAAFKRIKSAGTVSIFGKTKIFISDNISKDKSMALDFGSKLDLTTNMKVTTLIIKRMAMDSIDGEMEMFTQGSSEMI